MTQQEVADLRQQVANIREQGLGNGFTVLNPGDGFRKNDQLWFGTCAVCGEMVSSSWHDQGAWIHKLRTFDEKWGCTVSRNLDHCPTNKKEES